MQHVKVEHELLFSIFPTKLSAEKNDIISLTLLNIIIMYFDDIHANQWWTFFDRERELIQTKLID